MITNANQKDYYYKGDIDYYIDSEEELLSWDLTNIKHATKAYVINTGKTMILSGVSGWVEFAPCGSSELSNTSENAGGGTLVIPITFASPEQGGINLQTMGNTWGEIHDALFCGQTVLFKTDGSDVYSTVSMIGTTQSGDDAPQYFVETNNLTFKCLSEDGYPVMGSND